MKVDNSLINRETILQEINNLLVNFGFKTSNIYERSCFDILARKKDILIILKILVNIDSLTTQQAEELSKISGTFLASPIIIGLKSKHSYLEDDVVYERHEIPAVSPQTLYDIIANDMHPEILSKRGGFYVKINGGLLKKLREEKNLSLKELADLTHVSRETIYKYEQQNSQAYPETALLLEEILNKPITLSINILESEHNHTLDTKIQEPIELINLGYEVNSSTKTPFDAISTRTDDSKEVLKLKKELSEKIEELEQIKRKLNEKTKKNELLITNLERNRNINTLTKIAEKTNDISSITGHKALFVLKHEHEQKSINNIPVIYTWELENMEKNKDLQKLIKERENEAE
ncbi:MAG: transcriptional regulator [Methanosphaera sp. SHI613]|jgi:putative transcriptional regulator|nr:MAG: transcriptional regulator [Methanosphaera sp. SHI613]